MLKEENCTAVSIITDMGISTASVLGTCRGLSGLDMKYFPPITKAPTLIKYGKDLNGVIHCYSYSPEMAQEYVKMGYFIGVGGVVTFKNAKKLKETVKEIPLESIVLETDCPYLAPEPFRGKRNCSLYISYVAEKIAELKGISAEEVIRQTEENAKQLLEIAEQKNPDRDYAAMREILMPTEIGE